MCALLTHSQMLAGFSPRWHFAINLARAANDRKS